MADEVTEIKYAAQLCALDLGSTITGNAKTDLSSRVLKRTTRRVRRIEHYGPSFGSYEKKNKVYVHGVGVVLVFEYDSEVEVKHG